MRKLMTIDEHRKGFASDKDAAKIARDSSIELRAERERNNRAIRAAIAKAEGC